jgi:ABC-2 type transport system ATP-binding protein
MPIIEVSNLSKNFKAHKKEEGLRGSLKALFKREYFDVKAVSNVSFGIEEGELIGFIGPNGAGKTTTLKMLSGLLYPSSGIVSVLGFKPYERKTLFLKQISLIMGQKNQLWWDLPAIETLNLNKEIYEVEDNQYKKVLSDLVEMLGIKDILNIQVRKLSLGQRMKMELAAALIHSPKVLFLDEPTIGLDVVVQKRLRDFIKEYNKKYKATVILTSHYMEDVKELCRRVMIIDKGKLAFDGSFEDIINRFADHKFLKVVFSKIPDREKLSKVGNITESEDSAFTIKVKRKEAPEKSAFLLKNFRVLDLNIEEPKIEDVIREVFTGKDVS